MGITKSGESVRNIKGAWVAEQKVDVEGGEIVAFRVTLKISFVVDSKPGRSAAGGYGGGRPRSSRGALSSTPASSRGGGGRLDVVSKAL